MTTDRSRARRASRTARQEKWRQAGKTISLPRAARRTSCRSRNCIKSPIGKMRAIRKRALLNQQRHHMPGVGNVDPDRRIEIHDTETSVGRVHVQVERDTLTIHGVSTMLADVDRDLRNAIVTTSAAFASAETDIEQTSQRGILGIIIDGVLRRHKFLDAKVREAVTRQRYDI